MPRKTKKPAARKATMRKCKHKQMRLTWDAIDATEVVARHCYDCGERLCLGPSNDVGCEVELRSASWLGDLTVHRGWSADAWDDGVTLEIDAGTVDDGWPWDPTRPIAEQWTTPLSENRAKAIAEVPDDAVMEAIGSVFDRIAGIAKSTSAAPGELDARAAASPAPTIADVVDEPEAFDLEAAAAAQEIDEDADQPEPGILNCDNCGAEILGSHATPGIYFDGEAVTCADCGAISHISADGEIAWVSSWDCKHSVADHEQCAACEPDRDADDGMAAQLLSMSGPAGTEPTLIATAASGSERAGDLGARDEAEPDMPPRPEIRAAIADAEAAEIWNFIDRRGDS